MQRLESKVAVVTGAARGIGRGIALCLAGEGADIVLCDVPASVRESALQETRESAREVEALGRRALATTCDVRDREQVAALMAEAARRLGKVDIVVANAAVNHRQYVVDADWDKDLCTLEVAQFGVYHTCQAAARQMLSQAGAAAAGGKIVIISSVQAVVSLPTNAAYGMAKAAVNHLAAILGAELAPHRINVNAVLPGWIDTPGERAFVAEAELAAVGKRLPWGRLGTPHDIGRAVAYLASDDADYVTGTTLVVDGGLTASQPLHA